MTVNTHIFFWPKSLTTGLVKTPETNTEVLNRGLFKKTRTNTEVLTTGLVKTPWTNTEVLTTESLTDTLNFRTVGYFLTNLINDPSSLKLQSRDQNLI